MNPIKWKLSRNNWHHSFFFSNKSFSSNSPKWWIRAVSGQQMVKPVWDMQVTHMKCQGC